MDDDGKVVEWMNWMQLGVIYSESLDLYGRNHVVGMWNF